MILDRMARRVTNSARLTLDSPLGWDTGGSLYDGKTLGAMKLPAVNACIEIISDSVAKMPIYLMDSATRERQTNHPALPADWPPDRGADGVRLSQADGEPPHRARQRLRAHSARPLGRAG